MRPDSLNPLFADLSVLAGIGPKRAQAFNRLLSRDAETPARVIDLLFHAPTGVIDRRPVALLASLTLPAVATFRVRVGEHRPPPRGSRAPYRISTMTEAGDDLTVVFFRADPRWLERTLPEGSVRLVSGRIDLFDGRAQMAHPDHMVDPASGTIPPFEPVYRKTADLTGHHIRAAIEQALPRIPVLDDWLRPDLLAQRRWPGVSDALAGLHDLPDAGTPDSGTADSRTASDDIGERARNGPDSPGWQRLAYDELLAGQLALALVRRSMRVTSGIARRADRTAVDAAIANLPFPPTGAQVRSVSEIIADLEAPQRMIRLLQGDVGSGKTAVAYLAMAHVAASGAQSVLMAPTELLARQHYETLSRFAARDGLSVALLTGQLKTAQARAARDAAQSGAADIVVGTQALFQASTSYARLGLAVIDEQHRFGVHQRLDLAAKGGDVDLLVTTATPIPRTLLLSFYGDMDVSRLDEKPAGRQDIDTRIISSERIDEVVSAVGRTIERGERVYWVCPLVEESEAIDAQAAEARHAALAQRFGDRAALLHGRMRPDEKDRVTTAFRDGDVAILVATTVVEVGVDVPEASLIVVESAERFGLAQLHQLRGRVGRGAAASHCLLVYTPPLGDTAMQRLTMLRETNDGFRIAEEDLRLRGGGDVLGARQSGLPAFRIARPEHHLDLIETARDDARLTLDQDPGLTSDRGRQLRVLLHLFERYEATRYLDSG